MILIPSIFQPENDPRVEQFDYDRAAFDDPRTVAFRSGVECFACRKRVTNPKTAASMVCEAGPLLWAHRDCLDGKPAIALYWKAVEEVALGRGK